MESVSDSRFVPVQTIILSRIPKQSFHTKSKVILHQNVSFRRQLMELKILSERERCGTSTRQTRKDDDVGVCPFPLSTVENKRGSLKARCVVRISVDYCMPAIRSTNGPTNRKPRIQYGFEEILDDSIVPLPLQFKKQCVSCSNSRFAARKKIARPSTEIGTVGLPYCTGRTTVLYRCII